MACNKTVNHKNKYSKLWQNVRYFHYVTEIWKFIKTIIVLKFLPMIPVVNILKVLLEYCKYMISNTLIFKPQS